MWTFVLGFEKRREIIYDIAILTDCFWSTVGGRFFTKNPEFVIRIAFKVSLGVWR